MRHVSLILQVWACMLKQNWLGRCTCPVENYADNYTWTLNDAVSSNVLHHVH